MLEDIAGVLHDKRTPINLAELMACQHLKLVTIGYIWLSSDALCAIN